MSNSSDSSPSQVPAVTKLADASFRVLIESVIDYAIYTMDPSDTVMSWNEGATRLFGYTAEEMIGQPRSRLFTHEDIASGVVQAELEEAREHGSVSVERWRVRKDGTSFWAHGALTAARDAEGQLLGYVKVIRDLTAHKQAEMLVQASELRYRTLFESAPVGILYADAQSNYIDANGCICQMLGYTRDELIGLHASDIVSEAEVEHIGSALDEIHARPEHRREWRFRRKDGSEFAADVIATRFPDGTLLGMVRDVTELKEHEREIARISRLYAALSQINQGIVWSSNRDELLQKVCEALVVHGGFRLAWIGWHDPVDRRLVAVAQCGDENDFLKSINIYTDDRPESRGPSGTAFRTERPCISNDLLGDPSTLPWRDELSRRSFRAAAAFPIRLGEQVCGTLSVYADRMDYFHDKEIALLEEAATDISFALDNFARDEARLQAEAMVRSEKLFSDIMIESMPGIAYFYDNQGRFMRWNRNFEQVSGYSASEISQMHPSDFFSEEEKPLLEARIAEVFNTGESSVEASFVSRDGTTTPYFFTGRRVEFSGQPCLVGVGIDISKRRLAERGLAESERKYRELVEHANSIILRWNVDGRVTFLNEYGQRFFGYSAEEILGQHVTNTIVPRTDSGGRDLNQLIEQICADPEAFERNVNENVRRNGERVWIAWTNRIVHDARGQITGFLSIGSDITDRVRIEAEREKRFRAEAADRIKSAFLATMSHELRTPLNSIIGFTGIILQGLAGPLNAEQSKQLEMVRGSARHLLALVNDVLDISKIEAGQLEIACMPVDLRQSIAKVVALVTPQAQSKRLALEVRVPDDLGTVNSDERRFEQILLNLLSNAIKFTEHGQVALIAESVADYVSPGTDSGQAAVRLSVSDTGVGIKPEDLATLFQPFRQIDSGLARKHDGTGLGLAICRRLATLMGGEISAESEWGRGSVFSVILPKQGPVKQ